MKKEEYKKREERRLEKIVRKYHLKRGADFPKATAKYKRSMAEYLRLEGAVKEILDRRGESVVLRWAYLAFARKAFRLLKEGSESEAISLLSEWGKRGLKEKVLKEIYKKCRELVRGEK